MKPSVAIAALTGTALLAPVAAAHAGTITFDKACYARALNGGELMTVVGAGFSPNATLTLSGDGANTQVVTDPTGAFATQLEAPPTGTTGASERSIRTFTLQAQNAANPAESASAGYQVANFARSTTGASKPRSPRTFRFSGFPSGRYVYAHYRFGGRTIKTIRVGKTRSPCGLLSKKMPSIPNSVAVRYGTWTVQFDLERRFKSTTAPRLGQRFTIYKRYTYR